MRRAGSVRTEDYVLSFRGRGVLAARRVREPSSVGCLRRAASCNSTARRLPCSASRRQSASVVATVAPQAFAFDNIVRRCLVGSQQNGENEDLDSLFFGNRFRRSRRFRQSRSLRFAESVALWFCWRSQIARGQFVSVWLFPSFKAYTSSVVRVLAKGILTRVHPKRLSG
jgi:hypothetical protein